MDSMCVSVCMEREVRGETRNGAVQGTSATHKQPRTGQQ